MRKLTSPSNRAVTGNVHIQFCTRFAHLKLTVNIRKHAQRCTAANAGASIYDLRLQTEASTGHQESFVSMSCLYFTITDKVV
jgi:hypothetical protein